MISSPTNPKVKQWLKLHQRKYRHQYQRFIIEEQHLIEEALKQNLLETLIVLENTQYNILFDNVEIVGKEVMMKISHNTSLNKMVGIAKFPNFNFDSNRILLLDNIQDPGNMGTLLRSAYSFGYHKVYLSKGCVDIYNEKVVQASQGAIFYLDLQQRDLVELIKAVDYPIYATGFHNSVNIKNLSVSDKMGFVLGNEGNGVASEILALCPIVNIDMLQFDSLNVGVAGSICMYLYQGVKNEM